MSANRNTTQDTEPYYIVHNIHDELELSVPGHSHFVIGGSLQEWEASENQYAGQIAFPLSPVLQETRNQLIASIAERFRG